MNCIQGDGQDLRINRKKDISNVEGWVVSFGNKRCKTYLTVFLSYAEFVKAYSMQNEASAIGSDK